MSTADETGPSSYDDGLESDVKFAKVWDIPTRLFHWALAACVIVGWYLGNYRDFSTIEYHFYLGYATASLLVFRLIWGFIGPRSARFTTIIPTFKETIDYLSSVFQRQPSHTAGHNPLGGLAVILLLLVLSVQVITGLYAEDDSLFASGPFSVYATSEWVTFANDIHHKASRILLILIGLHVVAILYYQIWKRENLLKPMITGWKWVRKTNH